MALMQQHRCILGYVCQWRVPRKERLNRSELQFPDRAPLPLNGGPMNVASGGETPTDILNNKSRYCARPFTGLPQSSAPDLTTIATI
jgi:hypothetical protein